MSKPQFTPGPWKWTREGGHICLSPGILITDETDGTPWGDFRDRPNASLIEAAPDLYDALETVLAYRQGKGEFNFSSLSDDQRAMESLDAWGRVEDKIVAALAKAEGRNE